MRTGLLSFQEFFEIEISCAELLLIALFVSLFDEQHSLKLRTGASAVLQGVVGKRAVAQNFVSEQLKSLLPWGTSIS